MKVSKSKEGILTDAFKNVIREWCLAVEIAGNGCQANDLGWPNYKIYLILLSGLSGTTLFGVEIDHDALLVEFEGRPRR